jgi:hypothetical protein
MAEGGNDSEGQDSGAHLSSMHISDYGEMMAQNKAESEAHAINTQFQASQGWLEAVAKDERAQIPRRASVPSTRSWQSRQATFRAAQDWKRTVAAARRQVRYFPPSTPREPYGGGTSDSGIWRWWDKISTGLWKMLGIS